MHVPVDTCLAELSVALGYLQSAVYREVAQLDVDVWVTNEPVPWSERRSGEHRTLRPGDPWGRLFDCGWFRFSGRVPDSCSGEELVLKLDVSGELCVVDDDGVPTRGLTCAASTFDSRLGRPRKTILELGADCVPGQAFAVWADGGCNDLFGNHVDAGSLREASLALCRPALKTLAYDLEVLLDWLEHADRGGVDYRRVLDGSLKAALMLPRFAEDPRTIAEALGITSALLSRNSSDHQFAIDAIGHAHIDLAWLWPIRETRRKAARTFATALFLAERYPEYRFAMGQPQLWQWVKEDHPALYARIREAVAAGCIEPQGVTWVEADLNVTGGESLVRQILYGTRFYRDELGVVPDYLWEPDAFGYPGSLPQILAKSGVRFFGSQKMSWNEFNRFPHHSFVWQGIDGSAVLAHFFPEDTYNGPAAPRSCIAIERDYRQSDVSHRALMVFGIGDGGGGPGEEHLERLRRVSRLPGMPVVTQRWAEEFFRDWARDAHAFPVWQGELYLEKHQGTYTSQGAVKKNNRTLEGLLRQVELAASLTSPLGVPYPREALERIWKEVLLYQFHDILPGSSIKRVYDECGARYAVLARELAALLGHHLEALAAAVDTSAARSPVIVFNALSWPRTAWIETDGGVYRVEVPAIGYAVLDSRTPTEPPPRPVVTKDGIETAWIRIRFDADGDLVSVYDKRQDIEYIPRGSRAPQYTVYHDLRDAWDFVPQYRDMRTDAVSLVSMEPFAEGHRAGLLQRYRYRSSTLEIRVTMGGEGDRVQFRCRIDWREPERMLKVGFPVDVRSSRATCGIQFGAIERPTHSTTSWDAAKDEVAARWVDVSDETHGIALMSDCKYGYRVKDGALELTLVRSPRYPGGVRTAADDPDYLEKTFLDIGTHELVYSLVPHAGGFASGGIVRHADELAVGLATVRARPHQGTMPPSASLATVSDPAIVVEAVKQAEDTDETILRLYESSGGRRSVTVRFFDAVAARETNLMEAGDGPIPIRSGTVGLAFDPFEIKTIAVSRAKR